MKHNVPQIVGDAKVLLVVLCVVATVGCEGLLDVELPGQVEEEEALGNPQNASVLVNSTVAKFECAYTNYALLSGNVGDELMVAGSFAVFFPYDQREVTPDLGGYATDDCESEGGLYTPVSKARWLGDRTLDQIRQFPDDSVPDKTALLAETAAYTGFSYNLFGQSWCRAAFDEGPAVQPAEALSRAEERFTTAIDLGTDAGLTDIVNASRVGRARARLLMGDGQGAVSDAEQVDSAFVMMASRGTEDVTRENKIYVLNNVQRRSPVGPDFWDATWKGEDDPRVPAVQTGRAGNDAVTPWVRQEKYTSLDAPIPIASWEEAQLIIAEVEGGDRAVEIINMLHARADSLPAYDPQEDGPVQQHLIQERARELFLEGHRHYDMLRFGLPFPSGTQEWSGRSYGETTCFPLPNAETENNPEISS